MPKKKRRVVPAEVELCKPIVAMLRSYGWEVYQEVYPGDGDMGGCDIVATRGPVVWCIEVKRGWNLKIVSQAIRWVPYAHWTSIAVGAHHVPAAVLPALSKHGIGVLNVLREWDSDLMSDSGPDFRVEEWTRPRLNRHALSSGIKDWLCDEMKTEFPAGSAGGQHWSSWRSTCRRVAQYVTAHGPCTPKELFNNIVHHYQTPRSAATSIVNWVREGKIPGVAVEKRLGALVFFAVEIDDDTDIPELEVFDG